MAIPAWQNLTGEVCRSVCRPAAAACFATLCTCRLRWCCPWPARYVYPGLCPVRPLLLTTSAAGKDPSNNPQVEISWDYVDCAPFINGTIKMLIKPGGK